MLDASHELRTPLTSLRTNLEVIRRVDELSAEDRSVLVDDVLVQLQELTDLVGDLAELARGDRGAGGPGAAAPRPPGARRGRRAEHPRAGQGRPLRARRRAVLGRGAATTASAARRGQPARQRPQVEPARRARRRCECRAATVVVRDHGPGIAEADLPHIFDRFYRSPAARGLPGSGLGLAIVAQVVKAEGGTIVAENDPAGGARLSMRLPDDRGRTGGGWPRRRDRS